MSILVKLTAASFAVGIVGAAFVAPAQATTEHCDSTMYPNKVELDDGGITEEVDLADGTKVCIKAGTKTAEVEVVNGTITSPITFTNRSGKTVTLGISYYAYDCEGYDCDGGGNES